MHPYYSIPLSFALGGTLGIAIYLLVLKPLIRKKATVVILMIATLAVDIILLGILGTYSDALSNITRKATKKFIWA